jgi:hypothetical protein
MERQKHFKNMYRQELEVQKDLLYRRKREEKERDRQAAQ